jgi:hypothetical protein
LPHFSRTRVQRNGAFFLLFHPHPSTDISTFISSVNTGLPLTTTTGGLTVVSPKI